MRLFALLAAGEEGRGFAVVAREIEDLAEQAAQATQRVDQLATQIQSDAADALSAMASTQDGVNDSLERRKMPPSVWQILSKSPLA